MSITLAAESLSDQFLGRLRYIVGKKEFVFTLKLALPFQTMVGAKFNDISG